MKVSADTQLYQANGAGTAVDVVTNTPQFRGSDGSTQISDFRIQQSHSIAGSDIASASQFGGTPPASYRLFSSGGDLSLTEGAESHQ